jgi:hypothetical protein
MAWSLANIFGAFFSRFWVMELVEVVVLGLVRLNADGWGVWCLVSRLVGCRVLMFAGIKIQAVARWYDSGE